MMLRTRPLPFILSALGVLPLAARAAGPEAPAVRPTIRFTPFEKLAPLPSGPGLVVFDPVTRGAGAALQELGAGSARWLSYTLAGQPRFGKTPTWTAVAEVAGGLGFRQLALPPGAAAEVCRQLGATHAVVGELRETGEGIALTYRLLAITSEDASGGKSGGSPRWKEVGSPLRVEGPRAELTRGLAGLVRQLSTRLHAPTAVSASAPAAELQLMGHARRVGRAALTTVEAEQVLTAVRHSPFAAALYLQSEALRDPTLTDEIAEGLAARAGDNGAAWYAIAAASPRVLEAQRSALDALAKRFPAALLPAQAQRRLGDIPGVGGGARAAAERAVRCVPRSGDAWAGLAETIGDATVQVRGGRFTGQVSTAERKLLEQLYGLQLRAARKSASLSPASPRAWLEVAEAGTFSGETDEAAAAFWKAQRLAVDRRSVYSWGLQMFQSRWDGDAATLRKVARRAADEPLPTVRDHVTLSEDLRSAGFLELGQEVLEHGIERGEAAVKLHPEDPAAHFELGLALWPAGKLREATEHLRLAAAARAGSVDCHFYLAELLELSGQYEPAAAEYRETLRLSGGHAGAYHGLGTCLAHLGKRAEAEQALRDAVRLSPNTGSFHWDLAVVLDEAGKKGDALAECRATVRLSPFHAAANARLCELLLEDGQLSEAIEAGNRAVLINPGNAPAHTALAEAYLRKSDFLNAAGEAQQALRIDRKDLRAHRIRGEALLGQGKKDDAVKEWREVLTLDGGKESAEGRTARRLLEANGG